MRNSYDAHRIRKRYGPAKYKVLQVPETECREWGFTMTQARPRERSLCGFFETSPHAF
jgi:hypothetical protein